MDLPVAASYLAYWYCCHWNDDADAADAVDEVVADDHSFLSTAELMEGGSFLFDPIPEEARDGCRGREGSLVVLVELWVGMNMGGLDAVRG